MPSPRPIDGPDFSGIMYSACPFSCACVRARVRTGGYILQPDCRRLPVSFYFVQFLARSNEFWLDLVSIKVCIHFSTRCTTGCTTGWSKRLEYSFDQTRHVVYCPHSRLDVTQWRHTRPGWTAQAPLSWADSSSNRLYEFTVFDSVASFRGEGAGGSADPPKDCEV